ncbi:Butyrate kinase [Mucinivorans hirudinis]|uniref:Probable butyrate kinase n=1 Tax=Mucinivorans hirudinis TaxID=1433126 RepID=A0A060R866_9BACT|nr:Butyrate kinase [Mucinivorans hirudinis]
MSKILAINPGSTSTKIAVYEGETPLFVQNINHSNDILEQFPLIADQYDFRKKAILDTLLQNGIALSDIAIIVGRGGLIHPLESGVYRVNERMKHDLHNSPIGSHASNLGGLIADDLAQTIGGTVRAYIADPVVVDEMEDVARLTGLREIKRRSIFHALNQKAVARNWASQVGKRYEDVNVIVAHLGGGISVGAHRRGRVVDVNNALDGDGPFSPERAGSLPVGDLISLIYDNNLSKAQIRKMIKGNGGFVSLLGENSAKSATEKMEQGSSAAKEVVDAMSYNVGKWIGQMAAALCGEVDVVIVTGGIAHNKYITEYIKRMVGFIAPLVVIPGEDEMSALAMNGLRVLRGEVVTREY